MLQLVMFCLDFSLSDCDTDGLYTLSNINFLKVKVISYDLESNWYIFTVRQQSCGKVMFSRVCPSVSQTSLSTGRSHVIITYDALDLTLQAPCPLTRHQTWDPCTPPIYGT